MIDLDKRRTALYRLFDADGSLLYIGITYKPHARWRQHAKDKAWWPTVALREIEWIGTRAQAERAETAAIKAERPLHNIRETAWPWTTGDESPRGDMNFADWMRSMAVMTGYDPARRGGTSALARAAGLDIGLASRTLNGHTVPDIHNQRRIAKLFRVPLSEVMIRSGVAEPADFIGPFA